MLRTTCIAATMVAGLAAVSLPAAAQSRNGQNCEQTPERQNRRSVIGGIAGGVAGGLLGGSRVGRVIASVVPVQQMLSDAIMNMLDCDEQRKAADATEQLTQQAERGEVQVGSRVEWQSETRTGVTGASVVTQVDAPPAGNGQRCMTVTDVVIVDGEETTVPKRMCRTPPSTRWARA